MNPTAHDFVTVDMHGLKATLVARAQVRRLSVSAVVRDCLARELSDGEAASGQGADAASTLAAYVGGIKVSIRLTAEEAALRAEGARQAGLSRGAYLAQVILAGAASSSVAHRKDAMAALISSSAELSTLSRNLQHLTVLLRQCLVPPAFGVRGHVRVPRPR